MTQRTNERRAVQASWVIRDDRAGTLTGELSAAIDAANGLLERGELLDDDCGYVCWLYQFAEWRERCGDLLRRRFEQEAAAEFYGGTVIHRFPKERWREGRREGLGALGDMIQLLVTLRNTLGAGGIASSRRRDKGGRSGTV